MMKNQQITYPLAQINLNTNELRIIRHRRTVKRLTKEHDFASWLFRTITISSIISAILFGIGAMTFWQLEINSQPIPTINNKQTWQTKKHICLGWMLIAFSSFLGSASLAKKPDGFKVVEKS
ncbi:hypothetical protein [Anabaena subtropica]|uniref:Uncharacterized protein n=1 Tax=Anabaena subtropica FACHB-260 TaxID=2692884 RepID=A0ABR8CS43_9NOST|nr:hypothetical protein [Anabaena subtropica]MBD2346011.1 hypothetical protein [Anabaena subtropica FACHB-260]